MKTHENGYRGEHRVRGCLVYTLDMKALEEKVLEIMSAYEGESVEDLRAQNAGLADRSLVFGFDDKGRAWIVGTEGVGWKADESDNFNIRMQFGFGSTGYTVAVPHAVMRKLRSNEMVDLADHVRIFGDRLESNFSLWFDTFMAGSSSKQEVSA